MSEERGSALRLLFLIKANRESTGVQKFGQTNIASQVINRKYEESKLLEKTLVGTGL